MHALGTKDILLQTPHLEEATAFYRDTLGLRVFLSTPDLVGLEAGAFRIFLDRAGALGPVLEFVVDDVSEARRRLLHAGCTVLSEDQAIPRLYVRDPFGVIFNLLANPLADAAEPEAIREAEPPPHY